MQVCKYAHICTQYASMQVCSYMQLSKYASMHIYAIVQVCPYGELAPGATSNQEIIPYFPQNLCTLKALESSIFIRFTSGLFLSSHLEFWSRLLLFFKHTGCLKSGLKCTHFLGNFERTKCSKFYVIFSYKIVVTLILF